MKAIGGEQARDLLAEIAETDRSGKVREAARRWRK